MARPTECPCGSKQAPDVVSDGYGIFLFYACERCYAKKVSGYRSDIFERYECDEPIEGEEASGFDSPKFPEWTGFDSQEPEGE